MVVLGKNCVVLSDSKKTADVSAFADEVGDLSSVPIVDAAIAYDCPRTMETFLLIMRNALYVKSMENNLIPPFILREAGVKVNDVAK